MVVSRRRKSTFNMKKLIWTDFPIKYKIFDSVNRDLVHEAIKSFEKESCMRFKEMSDNFTGTELFFVYDKDNFFRLS
uniref:Peptidase M12A domain-containing protein n=1 Tax=Strongyloides venezuelensis TaxID=75913 RepID=A0A0K0EUB9_STRVS